MKVSYSPSKNEFILLMCLLIVVIAALAINYLILPEYANLTDSMQRYDNQQTLVENLSNEYAKLDSYKEEDSKLASDLESLRKVLPDYLSEEEILASLDDNAVSSGLDVLGITFSGVTTDTQDAFTASLKLSTAVSDGTTTGSSSGSSGYVQSEKINISYTGSYDKLIAFLSAFESQTRQVYFRSSTMSRTEDGELNGSLTMLVFSNMDSAPVANDPNYPGYDYDAPAAPGKADPFAAFSGYEGVTAGTSATLSTPDFYVILNTYDDNSDKILMGKYPVSSAQITSDDNQNVTATLTLTKSGSKCSYKYTLGSESYSGSFTLADTDTVIDVSVLSRARKSSLDSVGLTLNVQNGSGLPVVVTVKNDDASNPRFHLGTTSGSVQVVK